MRTSTAIWMALRGIATIILRIKQEDDMEEQIEIKNAVIEGASLTVDDRGILTAYLALNYGDSGQSFGGRALYLPESFINSKKPGNFAGHFICRVLKIAGISDWNDLVGKAIRVKAKYLNVIAIGHIIEDDWFNPEEEFKTMKGGD